MTAPIDIAGLGHPTARVSLVPDFASTGLTVAGLPEGWRKVRRDADIVTVSDLWLDVAEAERQADLDPSERFVSNALATAWTIEDLPVPAEHLLRFAEAMTTGVPGWSPRQRIGATRGEVTSTLRGALNSPFGELTSNSEVVIRTLADGHFLLAQLAVTALPTSAADVEAIHLAADWPRPLRFRGDRRSGAGNLSGVTADWRADTVETLRGLILGADSGVVEEIKWRKPSNPDGVPAFSLDGLICTVETYKDKVKVTFAKGASLPDPSNVFNASLDAGTRRAVDITQGDQVDPDAFTALVRAAIAVNRG